VARLNKTKIEWADWTWNPFVGCKNGCYYCFARAMARRFKNKFLRAHGVEYSFNSPHIVEGGFDFVPPKRKSKIFVGTMGDVSHIPGSWLDIILSVVLKNITQRWLFLTKNPDSENIEKLVKFADRYRNVWVGLTVTNQEELVEKYHKKFSRFSLIVPTFLCLEPLTGPIDLDVCKIKPGWIIVGAMTGPYASKNPVDPKWLDAIEEYCINEDVPLFYKDSLNTRMWWDKIYPQNLDLKGENGRTRTIRDEQGQSETEKETRGGY
jgi:protein gp37